MHWTRLKEFEKASKNMQKHEGCFQREERDAKKDGMRLLRVL